MQKFAVCTSVFACRRHVDRVTDKEIEIAHKLGQEILEDEEMLVEASDICGELDWYVIHHALNSMDGQ